MSIDAVIVAICSFAIILLGLLIVARNHRQKINQLFGFLALSMTLWTVFNYLSVVYPTSLVLTRLVFFAGVLTALGLLTFVANFPIEAKLNRGILARIFRISSGAMLIVVFLPQFIKSVTVESIETSYLYPLFILYALYAFILLILIIRQQNHSAHLKEQKQQVRLVSTGVMLYAIFAVLSNLLLPLVLDNWSSSRFGPAFSLLLVGVVAYSIVKHKLFDIRLIVARSVGYLLTLTVIGVFYAVIVFGLVGLFLGEDEGDLVHQIVYIASAIFLALTLQPIRNFFDKFSNKLFYRDNYDPQSFIDELNTVLVSTIDLNTLLEKSSNIITNNLKAEFCIFDIKGSNNSATDRQIQFGDKKINPDELHSIKEFLEKSGATLVIADNLDIKERELLNTMTKADVAIAVSMLGSKESNSTNFIFLGKKKSGNPFNKQDRRVIGIIADELSIAIQNALRFEEISTFNETLQDKVTTATRQLRHTNEKLKALDETKDEFISMASHQLRTPLTSVKGYVSMVLEGDAGELNEQQKKLLNQAFISSQRMVYLIADLLNVSRLRTGKFVIETAPTFLPDVVEGELSQLYETAEAKGLKLKFDKPADFPTLTLDETKIRQVIMNFADNAIYYTPAGGEINVQLSSTPQAVEFKVIDNGLGVPKKEQHHLFGKFYRAENAKRARPDGTGLGLFMAKKVVIAQGGAIIFNSREGKGSTFGFTFPRKGMEADKPVPKT